MYTYVYSGISLKTINISRGTRNSTSFVFCRPPKKQKLSFFIFISFFISQRLHRIGVRSDEVSTEQPLRRFSTVLYTATDTISVGRQLPCDIQTCEHTVWKSVARIISSVIRLSEKSMSLIICWHTGIATSNVCASVSPVIRPHSYKNCSYRSRHRADNWECVTIISSSRFKFLKGQYDSRRTCLLSHGNRYSRADKAWMYVLQLVAILWHRE